MDDPQMEALKAHPWFQSRPPKVQEAILRYPPHLKYYMAKTNQIVRLVSVEEDEDGEVRTCKVDVLGLRDAPEEFQPLFQRRVFGVPLADIALLDSP